MDISDLLNKVRLSEEKRTEKEKISILKQANIIDENGFLCVNFFSHDTIQKDKINNKPLLPH